MVLINRRRLVEKEYETRSNFMGSFLRLVI